jgi:hypothetical protein
VLVAGGKEVELPLLSITESALAAETEAEAVAGTEATANKPGSQLHGQGLDVPWGPEQVSTSSSSSSSGSSDGESGSDMSISGSSGEDGEADEEETAGLGSVMLHAQ